MSLLVKLSIFIVLTISGCTGGSMGLQGDLSIGGAESDVGLDGLSVTEDPLPDNEAIFAGNPEVPGKGDAVFAGNPGDPPAKPKPAQLLQFLGGSYASYDPLASRGVAAVPEALVEIAKPACTSMSVGDPSVELAEDSVIFKKMVPAQGQYYDLIVSDYIALSNFEVVHVLLDPSIGLSCDVKIHQEAHSLGSVVYVALNCVYENEQCVNVVTRKRADSIAAPESDQGDDAPPAVNNDAVGGSVPRRQRN